MSDSNQMMDDQKSQADIQKEHARYIKPLGDWKRSHNCGALSLADDGREVCLMGWVQYRRDHGGLIFVDLRDRDGLTQVVFSPEIAPEAHRDAHVLRSEYVLAIRGRVRPRPEGMRNPNLATGEIEVVVLDWKLLNTAKTPPFPVEDRSDAGENLRLAWRYLDLRRPRMANNLRLRHRIVQAVRSYLNELDFLEVETPILTKSTPEGARDFLVPSRLNQGQFYALPQSPQQFKQMLMMSGVDRYYQVARCFRDEDLRADRQPEFTQIDLEMSFVEQDDVIAVNEGFLQRVFKEVLDIDIQLPLPRLTWREAMDRFGSDKPDTRFGFEIKDISDIAANCGFGVFKGAVEAGGTVRLININGYADKFPRKEIDKLADFVKTYRAKGLAWMKVAADGSMTSSFAKFLTEEEIAAIKQRADMHENDVLFVVADASEETALVSLGALRCELAKRLGLAKKDDFKLLWVTEFPQFEYSEEEDRLVAKHHPFTAPMDEDIPLLDTDPAKVRAKAYDIILNGCELGGGSIRIHDPELQTKMFEALGFTEERAKEQFGHLITAFSYGAPPHGGLAYGLDRLCMLLAGLDSIRDVIAFPKVQNASDLMMSCPDVVDDKQLDDLSIAVTRMEKEPEA